MVQGKLVMAEKVLTELIEFDEKDSTAFYLRGRLRFQLAKTESIGFRFGYACETIS